MDPIVIYSIMNATHFLDLVTPVQNKMYRFALSMLGDPTEAEDVTQDIILKLWEKRQELNLIENVEAWLIRAVKNKCIDRFRAKRNSEVSLDHVFHYESQDQSPASVTESNDLMKLIQTMMEELPDGQRDAILLRDVQGYAYEEIADELNMSLSQVKINIHRARKFLKTELQKVNIHGS